MTFLLSFAGAFLGAALLAREARRSTSRDWPVIAGLLLIVLSVFAFAAAVFVWLTT